MESQGNTKKIKEPASGSSSSKGKKRLEIEGYPVEGLSIGGRETCVIFPSLKIAFDIGRCPQRAISQDFLFISHGHMDHIGGLPMYVATRGLYCMKPPTIFVPVSIKEHVEKLFEVHRAMDQSELKHSLIGLNVGEEFQIRKDLKVRAFRTYHVIPSQGYIIYSVRQKLKEDYTCLSGNEIKNLRLSGVEITYTVTSPEIAFTGDTTSDFIVDADNADALKARILVMEITYTVTSPEIAFTGGITSDFIVDADNADALKAWILVMESTFVDDSMTAQSAREYGHTHLSEIASYADWFQNQAILLIHFSARYWPEEIYAAIAKLPASLRSRVFALTEGF